MLPSPHIRRVADWRGHGKRRAFERSDFLGSNQYDDRSHYQLTGINHHCIPLMAFHDSNPIFVHKEKRNLNQNR